MYFFLPSLSLCISHLWTEAIQLKYLHAFPNLLRAAFLSIVNMPTRWKVWYWFPAVISIRQQMFVSSTNNARFPPSFCYMVRGEKYAIGKKKSLSGWSQSLRNSLPVAYPNTLHIIPCHAPTVDSLDQSWELCQYRYTVYHRIQHK